ncbi:PspC domain-containing protein [Hymenobacter metallilatus]|uniref:PspC domain-containing protein n=1 Tax=Hymenobacter metallilatus TaxID=2493666 RepID=A0A3R9NIV4_9BACT|nr:PspC domain-containing protein [Hymenobacter metallilatus]RSK33994.1 PspC domain-containing protein [Hymenobacter metallilatus]
MKKNISINLQGMIFHIEEDGYEVLSRYLAEVKAHFSGYRGHEEIVADIESRIAELFAARLSSLKQVITLEDVEAMTAKMGRVSDFQSADEAEDEEELLAEAVANGSAQGTYTGSGRSSAGHSGSSSRTQAGPEAAAPDEAPKQMYRDMANRKVAGVAAGLAHYFNTNALWIRLGLLVLVLAVPAVFDNSGLDNFGERVAGFTILSYVILWAVLPKRYDAIDPDTDPAFKKLYRDTDNGKVGGVSAGLAAYLRVDVVVVRIAFLLLLFAGSLGFWLYVILWILLPEAKTASDKLRMRGDAVTLSALDENLRNNPYAAGSEADRVNNRPVGTFLEDSFSNVRPIVNSIGSLIRVVAGGILTLTGFGILLTVVIALGVGLGLISSSDDLDFGPLQPFLIFNDISVWAVLSFFLLTAIPALALLLTGVGLLLRRTVLSRTASLTLLGLWLLGIVGSSVAAIRVGREFQREEEITQTTALGGLSNARLVLERRQLNSGKWVDLDIVGIDSAQAPRLERIIAAKGSSDSIARRNAATSTLHTLRILNDSTLSVDDHFTYQPSARFRDQEMRLRLLMPRGRTFRMTETFADWLNEEDYMNGQAPFHPENFVYRMNGNKVECVNCKESDLRSRSEDAQDEDREDYEEGRSDSNVNLDFERIEPINTDEDSYGSERQTFSESNFDHITIVGGYRALIRQGSSYSVRAAGSGRALRDIKVERDGNELTIAPRNRDLFDSRRGDDDDVLLIIETPELNNLELVGGTRADVSGFNSSDLSVEQTGGSQLRFHGELNELSLTLTGGCQAALQGSAGRLKVQSTAGCDVAAADFTARRADVDAIGASKVRLHVTEELKADAVGASVIEYSGRPSQVRREAVGAASIRTID